MANIEIKMQDLVTEKETYVESLYKVLEIVNQIKQMINDDVNIKEILSKINLVIKKLKKIKFTIIYNYTRENLKVENYNYETIDKIIVLIERYGK